MKDWPFRRRRAHPAGEREQMDADVVSRRLGLPDDGGRDTDDDPPWDRPAEDPIALMARDARAGGPAWDRPTEDEFAPPLPQDGPHWAFREPTDAADARDDRSSADRSDERFPAHWAFGDPEPASDGLDRAWTAEDGARLVTVGRVEEGPPPDPAQPGMFDPYDAFAPVVEDPWWGPVQPEQRSWPEPVSPRAVTGARPPASAGSAVPTGASVFGDLFTPRGGASVAPTPPSAAEPRPAVPVPVGPDPREWPPIPTGLLPPVPQSLAETPNPEPDGRRFTWPPPQPRVAPPASTADAAETSADPAQPEGQESLWPTEAAPVEPPAVTATTAYSVAAPARPLERGAERGLDDGAPAGFRVHAAPVGERTLLVLVATAALVLALIVLLARLIGPLLA